MQLADWLFALGCWHLGGRGKAARGRSRRRSGWANWRLLPSAVRLRRRGNGMLVGSEGQRIEGRRRGDIGQIVVGLKSGIGRRAEVACQVDGLPLPAFDA